MGLDQYLAVEAEATKEQLIEVVQAAGLLRYWEFLEPKEVQLLEDSEGKEHFPIVAYWRKVNAIHSWFVRNLADGVDECQRIPASREQLADLVDHCKRVLVSHAAGVDVEEAAEREGLGTQGGFFFGSTDYGPWYLRGLEETVEQIQAILDAKELDAVSIFYRASW